MNELVVSLYLPISLAFIAFVWLRTNAFVDFLGWLLLPFNIGYIGDYKRSGTQGVVEYPLWLYSSHKCFLTKLLSCPLCVSFWLNVIFSSSILELAFNAFITLFAFSSLDKLYKQAK